MYENYLILLLEVSRIFFIEVLDNITYWKQYLSGKKENEYVIVLQKTSRLFVQGDGALYEKTTIGI